MSNCELLATCPFFDNAEQDMFELRYRDQYCQGEYTLCGRYMSFQARQRELERKESLELFRTEEDGVKATSVKT